MVRCSNTWHSFLFTTVKPRRDSPTWLWLNDTNYLRRAVYDRDSATFQGPRRAHHGSSKQSLPTLRVTFPVSFTSHNCFYLLHPRIPTSSRDPRLPSYRSHNSHHSSLSHTPVTSIILAHPLCILLLAGLFPRQGDSLFHVGFQKRHS